MRKSFKQWLDTEGKQIEPSPNPIHYVFQYLLKGAVPEDQADILEFEERFLVHYHSIDCTQIQSCFDSISSRTVIRQLKELMRWGVIPYRLEIIKGSSKMFDVYYLVKLQRVNGKYLIKR